MNNIEKARIQYKEAYKETNRQLSAEGNRSISRILKDEYPQSHFSDAILFSLVPSISMNLDNKLFVLEIKGYTRMILSNIESHMEDSLDFTLSDLDQEELNNFVKAKSKEGWMNLRGTSSN